MTQRQGLFTVQTWLILTARQRARLEWLVRQQGGDLADTLSRIVAEHPLDRLPGTAQPAGEPLPVRVFLTAEQREAFERWVEANKIPLPDLLSQIVAAHLAGLPDPPERGAPPAATPTPAELRRRRNDLARLRARRDAAGATAPAWLHAYIAELEAELQN